MLQILSKDLSKIKLPALDSHQTDEMISIKR